MTRYWLENSKLRNLITHGLEIRRKGDIFERSEEKTKSGVEKVDEEVEVPHSEGESVKKEKDERRESQRHEGSEEDKLVEVNHSPEDLS